MNILNNKRFAASFLIMVFFVAAGPAQSGSETPQAKDTNGKADQNLRGASRINPTTLALEFSLPMMTYPGRRGSTPFGLNYSSKVWRMDDYATYWYAIGNCEKRFVTLLRPIYSERSTAGWSSSISFPTIEERVELFDQEGKPYNVSSYEDDYNLSFLEAMTLNSPGSTVVPPEPGGTCGWRCTTYWCEPIPDHPNGNFLCTCQNWNFIYTGCNPGWGGNGCGSGGLPPPDRTYYVKRTRVRLGDGTTHEFRKSEAVHSYCVGGYNDGEGCNGSTSGADNLGDFSSVDGSGTRLNRTAAGSTLYFPNGSRILFSATGSPGANQTTLYYATEKLDSDGNRVTYNYTVPEKGANPVRSITDTLGRQLVDPLPRNFSQQNQTEGDQPVSIPGLNGTQTYTYKWRHLEPVPCPPGSTTNCGNPEGALDEGIVTRHYTSHYCFGNVLGPTYSDALFPSDGIGLRSCNPLTTIDGTLSTAVGLKFNPVVLAEVVLPNGQSYKFRYNQYGEIVKLTHPTGAFERFTYSPIAPVSGYNQAAYDQANRGVTDHRVYDAGGLLIGRTKYTATADIGGGTYTTTTTFPHQNASSLEAEPNGVKTVRKMYASDPNDVKFGFETALAGMVYDEQTYDENQSLRSRTLTSFKTESTSVGSPSYPGIATAERDARPEKTVSITFDGGSALATLTTIVYDQPGSADAKYFSHLNARSKKSTHFASVSAGVAASTDLTWSTINSWFTNTVYASSSETDYKYSAQGGDPYMARGIIGMITESRILDPTNPSDILSKTQFKYDTEGQYPMLIEGTNPQWIDPGTLLRGKVTTTRKWIMESDTWLESHAQYDNFGNLRKAWDASGDTSKFVDTQYSSTFGFAFPTTVISPAPDPTNTNGTNQATTTNNDYDLPTGLPLGSTDEFGQTIKTEYNDPLLRPKRVYGYNFTAPEVATNYDDTNLTVTVTKPVGESGTDEVKTYLDSLGRVIKTQAKDSQGDVYVETHYDSLGRVERVSNPYRLGDTVYWNKTRYDELGRAVETFAPVELADLSNAPSLGVTSHGISTVPGFFGTVVATTDASGRQNRSITNALGQLIRVDEPAGTTGAGDLGSISAPLQATIYSYDEYGNMARVQQGNQYRYFKYDSLGRLIRVNQPEQDHNPNLTLADSFNPTGLWTAGFAYDVLGNLVRATDANGVNIINDYDRAGRVKKRCYTKPNFYTTATTCAQVAQGDLNSDTPTVNFYYDGKGLAQPQSPNYAKGKLTKVDNGISATENMTFNNLGRLTRSRQITDGVVYGDDANPMTYDFTLAGALKEERYPSGRIVRNDFETDGDLLKVTSAKTPNAVFATYVSDFLYTASGGIKQMKLGNGLWETTQFNTRNQVEELGLGSSPTDTGLWKINYFYGEIDDNGNHDPTKNTGNIAKQTLSFSGLAAPFIQAYKYDPLYRLKEAKETTNGGQNWIQNWTYDRYGNRSSFTQNIGGNTTALNPYVDQLRNRFTGSDFIYDKNGNVTRDRDGITNQLRTFVFNADNKQTEVKDANNVTIGQYFYDGEGKRVKEVITATGETTIFVYSAGKLIGEYSTASLPPVGKINYTTTDHLGSPRVITDQSGQVTSRRDFRPFGEDIPAGIGGRTGDGGQGYSSSNDKVRQKFTGYQKDTETGLDFAEVRMYENRFGRFTAVDPLLASGKSATPQSFNRYVYVVNNPIALSDPSGLDPWWKGNCSNGRCEYRESKGKPTDGAWEAVDFKGSWFKTITDWGSEGSGVTAYLYDGGGQDFGLRFQVYQNLLAGRDAFADTGIGVAQFVWNGVADNSNAFFRAVEQPSPFSGGSWDPSRIIHRTPYWEPANQTQANAGLAMTAVSLYFTAASAARTAGSVSGASNASPAATATAVQFEQYALRARRSGLYPVMQRGFKDPVGTVFLNKGDVWKYGQTMNPRSRYSQSFLDNTGMGLNFDSQFKTTSFKSVIQREYFKIVDYETRFGFLPPGNKIRR